MRAIEELNNITTEYEDIEIDTYFDVMDITEEQKKEREKAAEDIAWLLLLLFALIKTSIEDGDLDYVFIKNIFNESYTELVNKYAESDPYIRDYIDKFVMTTLDSTWDHLDFSNPDNYWTSRKRAIGIAVNEANTILNYKDLVNAIKEGKNAKIWKTQGDAKVRLEHALLENKVKGITELFRVGSSLLLFPRDELHCIDVRDIANCRCYAQAIYDPRFKDVTLDDLYQTDILEGYQQNI